MSKKKSENNSTINLEDSKADMDETISIYNNDSLESVDLVKGRSYIDNANQVTLNKLNLHKDSKAKTRVKVPFCYIRI